MEGGTILCDRALMERCPGSSPRSCGRDLQGGEIYQIRNDQDSKGSYSSLPKYSLCLYFSSRPYAKLFFHTTRYLVLLRGGFANFAEDKVMCELLAP